MTLHDRIIAMIRTVVPYLWSAFIAWLIARVPAVGDAITWLNDTIGQDVTALVSLALVGGALAAYHWLVTLIQPRFPRLYALLMGSSLTPVYGGLSLEEQRADREAREALTALVADIEATEPDSGSGDRL